MATKKSTADDWNKALSTWTKKPAVTTKPTTKKKTTTSTSDRLRENDLGRTQGPAPRPVSTSDRLRSGSSTPAVQTVKEKPKKKKKDSFSEALDTWNTKVVQPSISTSDRLRGGYNPPPAQVLYETEQPTFDYGIDRVDTLPGQFTAQQQQSPTRTTTLQPYDPNTAQGPQQRPSGIAAWMPNNFAFGQPLGAVAVAEIIRDPEKRQQAGRLLGAGLQGWRDIANNINPSQDYQPYAEGQQPNGLEQYQAPPKQQFDYGIDRVDTGVQPIQQSGYGPDALDPGFNPSMYKPPTQGANTVTSPIGPQWGNPGANQPQTKPTDPWAQRMAQVKRAWSPGPTDLPGRVGAALEGADRFWGETFPDWYAKTPGAQYAADNEEWRQTNGPSNRNAIDKPGWDRTRDTLAWLGEQAFTVPEKAVETTQIPGTGYITNALTGQQGGDISLGQFLPAVGEAINRTWNATSLNRGRREGEGYIPAETQVQPLITFWNVFTNALNESRQARDTIEQMEGDGKDIGLFYLSSGGNRAVTASTNIVNQDKNVAALYAKAEQAQQQAEALEAEGRFDEAAQLRLQSSQAGKDALELKNKTKTEIADMEMNPWAEIITGILLDPTNALDFGLSVQTMKKAAEAAAFNVSPTQADNILTGITNVAPKVMTWGDWLYQPLTDGTRFADDLIGPDVAKWANYINPAKLFERTGDTKAHLATDTLYRAAVQLFTDVTDKETARQILTAWTKDPAQLVRGLQTKNGLYQVGGGILANPYVVPYYPLLTKMSDQIVNLSSLAGEGGFNPIEVLAELNDVLYKGARGGMGLTAMAALPAGTISTRLVKTGANTAVLEYVGKSNKVISRSAEMITQDAQALQKTIRKAAQAAGPGSSNLLMSVWGMQKAILSDMYLGMQPGYWIKNALSATTHLLADNNMTLLPTKQIVGDLDRWYGGAPTTRTLSAQAATIGGAAADAMAGGQHWAQRIFGANNPYSKMMKKLYSIPFGATDIAGRIPFGEQNFALRGTYVPIKRYITEGWDNVSRIFAQTLEANGVDPALAATLRGVVRDAGVNGNKQRIAQEAKKAIAAATVRQSLSELGVPDELLSAKSWADLQDIFNTYTPAEIEQAADAVKNIFRNEFKQPAEILAVAPPQPSRDIYSASDTVRDNAAMIDGTVDDARRAGDNPDMVRQSSEQLADQVAKAETTLWEKLRNDVAGSEDPRALNVALDLLGKWHDWRESARQRVNDLSKIAIREDTTQAWQAKWKGTQAIYGEFVPWFEQAVETARHGILTGKAEGYDWFKAIQRYADYDDFAVQAERRAGGDLAGPASELYSTVIAANREFLDSTVVELFSAFKRYASQDSLDILASGLRTVEEMGAHTAQYVAKQRELLAVKKISKEKFYNLRNAAWTQFFDNAAIYNKVQQRLIVARGVAENVASGLKWVDDFAGGEFQLIGRGADGMWEARHTGDNVVHRFADPEDTRSAMPQVPANIIEDFNRAIGNIEGTVDEIIGDITTAAGFDANVERLASAPTGFPGSKALDEAEGLRAERAAATVSGGTEARAQIRAEWDRVAKGEGGYLTIDRAIQSYTRNGVVSVPENKFADLYGTTIAGQRIDNQADVDRLLQQYYDMGQQRLQRKVAAPANDLNALRQAARDAGIPTLTDAGKPLDKRLVNTINKDLGLKLRGLRDLTPEQYQAAMEALARRATTAPAAAPITRYAPPAEQVATVERTLQPVLERVARRAGTTVDELVAQGNQALQPLLQSPVAVQVSTGNIDNILASGELQNAFSTRKTSAGKATSLDYRASAEAKGLGIPTTAAPEEHAVYGYLLVDDYARKLVSTPQFDMGYGDISFVLKDDVRARTTFTVGDSVNQFDKSRAVGIPLTGEPSVTAWGAESPAVWGYAQNGNIQEFLDQVAYVETHTQGGVKLSDVRQVLDPNNKLTPAQIQRLEAQGIQVLQGTEASVANLGKGAPGPEMRELDFTIPGLDLSAVAKRLGVDPYTLTKGLPGLDFFGMGQGGNLYEWIKGLNSKVEKLAGDKAPEMGELAAHTIRTLNDAENKILSNLEAILAGKPNTMTPAQQIRAMEELNNILPQFDNILAGAAKVGEDAANFTMLNYNDRRNIDALWGFLSPYHYYFSRTPLNWAKRIAQKPAILSQWYRSKRAIDAENEQQNLPEHLRGTIPNPIGIGPDRLGNPLTWLIPISMVMGNDFVDPNEARTEAERWYMYQQKYLPGLAPVVQFGVAAYLDETAPLPNGKSRVQQIQLGDFVPLYRLGGYGYQAMTGNLGPQNAAGFGDEYDYGRAGKQVALQEVRGDIKPGQGAWGIDVGYQNQTGAKPLPEQPAGAPQVWQAGAQRSGLERFVNRLLSFGLGVPGYYYSDAERQMRDMKENRVGLGYSADNPYGSKAAVNEYTGQDGDIYDASFNYSALYPGGENRKRPGVAAATNDYWKKVNPVYDQMNQAAELFLIENPNASSKELNEVKKPYYDKIKAIKEKFPSIKGEGKKKGRNVKYMSPQERAEYEIKGLLEYEPPNKPEYPGEKADPKVLQQYYKDKATWDAKRLMQIDRNLNQLYSGETATYLDPWLEIAQDLIGGKYSSELMRVNGLRNAEQVEKAWSQRQSFVEEVSDAEYRNRTKNVTSRLGEDGVAIYNEFFATPKGEERDAFADENPEVQISLFAGYHPQEFDTFVQKFGQEGLGIAYLAQKPEYPGENAGDAAMQQYYGQLDAYNKQYPQAEEINLWLKGRRFGPDAPNDDYGRAYNEAIGIFGPDIFEVINSFPSGGTKAQIGAWYRSNGNKAELRSAYFAWRREHGETDALANGDWPDPIYPGNEGAGQGYTGPRPVGMDYVPVGENRWWETPQQPNRWATTDWATLAGQQADNPWTQRANELNASLLGEQPIPSEMAGMLDEEGNPIAANSYSPSSMSAEDYVRAANEGKSGGGGYSRRSYGGGGYSRRYYGGGGGGNYYAPQVEGRGLSEWLNVDPQRVGYQAPNQVRVNVPDIGPEAIRAWRPLSWK